jgi:signal transduction histidine kinase
MKPDGQDNSAKRWLDPVLTMLLLIICEIEVLADLHGDSGPNHWPMTINALLVAGMTIPIAWRRRAPEISGCIVVISFSVLLTFGIPDVDNVYSPLFALFTPTYSIAAYVPRRRGLKGLVVCEGALVAALALNASPAPAWVLVLGAASASYVVGRVMHARRRLAVELARTNQQIAAEREARERLAISEQRTLIAAELQELVANSVSDMIVQARAAQSLLDERPARADEAMATLEDTGRQALAEMRRILGVLRRADQEAELAPQPGIGQIPALVGQVRENGGSVSLTVVGEPGPLPASVDLGLYRIVHDAFASLDQSPGIPIEVSLSFTPANVELQVIFTGQPCLSWPTVAMTESVALCQGDLDVETIPDRGDRLLVRLPLLLDGAPA